MVGTLTEEQSEHVLRSGLIGRVGCSDGNDIYVVPVTYVYEDHFVYVHSRVGMKVQIMRKNSRVCFEVDSIENMTNWRSVMIQGDFEELTTAAGQAKALKILKDRLVPYLLSETMRPKGFDHAPERVEKALKPVFYRIKVERMTGRFEKNTHPGNFSR